MPSTYTPNNGLTLQATGENNSTWGTLTNDGVIASIDTALDGAVTLSLSGTSSSLAITDGAASDGRNRVLLCTGTLSANHTITVTPNDAEKWYVLQNNTTGGYSVIIGQGGGSGTTVTVLNGYTKLVRLDGTGTNANATELMPNPYFGGTAVIGGTLAVGGPLSVTGAGTFITDITVNSVDVGRGGGSVATNTAVGDTALAANTSGSGNTAFGGFSFYQLTTGVFNTGAGYAAGFQNTGNYNTAIGYAALYAASASAGNTAVGYQSLNACTGDQNVAVGNTAGSLITSGIGNVIIGNNTGTSIATDSYNVLIADGAGTSRLHINSSGEASLGSTPVSKLALDIPSTTKAFRPPAMTTAQRDAIASPPTGGMIYNTTTNKLNVYTGSAWEAVTSA